MRVSAPARLALALGALAACGYTLAALGRTRAFARRPPDPAAAPPPTATVIRPLHGLEPGLEENLVAACAQDHPAYRVLFAARDPRDPALVVARRVAAAHPHARVVAGDAAEHRNPKIRTLAGIAHHVEGEIVVVADADVRVGPGWLRAVCAPFADPAVGAVTCLYRGLPVDGPVAALGAMGIEENFAPSVLVAGALEEPRYLFGATLALRTATLRRIGGFAIAGDRLADDHALGAAVVAHGERIRLAREVVATVVPETGLTALWAHELRWARTTRALRPREHRWLWITHPLPLALALLLLDRRPRALAPLALALALRLALHGAARRALGVTRPSAPWLVPARDLLSFAVWCASLGGRAVRWRDATLALDGERIAP